MATIQRGGHGFFFLALWAVPAASGCDDRITLPVHVVSVEVAPTTAEIAVGESQAFEATATFSDRTTLDITRDCNWSSEDETVATIDGAGIAEALAGGTIDVQCTFESVAGTATLTVSGSRALIRVVVRPPDATVAAGDTVDLRAVAEWDDGTGSDVTDSASWVSADDAVAAVVAGTVTGVSGGTTTITASFGGVESNAATIIVQPWIDPLGLRIVPAEATIDLGTVQPFAALLRREDGREADVTSEVAWESSDTEAGTVDSSGLARGVGPGLTTITAELGGLVGTAQLVVRGPMLVGIVLTPAFGTLHSGSADTLAIRAAGAYADGSMVDLTELATWETSDETIANVSNEPGSRGVVRPGTDDWGVVQITATYDGVVSSPAVVSVLTDDPVVEVDVSPPTAAIVCGDTISLSATAIYADGRTVEITDLASWSSSDETAATVDVHGVVTGVGLGGLATITATVGGVSGRALVLVSCDRMVSIAIAPNPAPSLPLGRTQQFTATATYTDLTSADVTEDPSLTWSSSTPTVATISNDAGRRGLATSVGVGSATITARYVDPFVDLTSPGVALTVMSCSVDGLTIIPSSATLAVGSTMVLRAEAVRTCGIVTDETDGISWTSADETVATVTTGASPRGVVTGMAPGGPVTITGTLGAVSATMRVTVVP